MKLKLLLCCALLCCAVPKVSYALDLKFSYTLFEAERRAITNLVPQIKEREADQDSMKKFGKTKIPVALADFDHDGKKDIFALFEGYPTLSDGRAQLFIVAKRLSKDRLEVVLETWIPQYSQITISSEANIKASNTQGYFEVWNWDKKQNIFIN